MNFDELKLIKRNALISEIIRKTESCALNWNKINNFSYKATGNSYEFYITKTQSNYILDIRKNGKIFNSYNSLSQSGIDELYTVIDSILGSDNLNNMKMIISSMSKLKSGCKQTYNDIMNGGAYSNPNGYCFKTTPTSIFLLPSTLDFEDLPFPWTGTAELIDDLPNVLSSDGDGSFISQTVHVALPNQWGFANVGFLTNGIGNSGPYVVSFRVSHRRGANDGVQLMLDIVANSSVVFSDSVVSNETYSIYNSGPILISSIITSLTDLSVRLSIFTNSGNEDPRTIYVSAVDINVSGFNMF